MSTARQHAEWLSLLEISGPFLSMPVLLRAFPQGLDAHDPDALRELRLAYDEWRDDQEGARPDPAVHRAWVRFVLEHTLNLPRANIAEGQAIAPTLKCVSAEHGETLRPDLVIVNPAAGDPSTGSGSGAGQARLLVQIVPVAQDPDKPLADYRWKASPATRILELLRASGVRLGLVTNGEQWMLVDAPRDGTSAFISWYASLWIEEPITLRAFRSLLGAYRFFGVSEGDTLEALLAASASDQQEVTEQLGYQVRRAVGVLIQAIDRTDQERGRTLLGPDAPPERLYEAALTVMMRLVFLFSAEERKLLLLGDPLYDQHYAVSTLSAQLRETADQQGEEVLERRLDAWNRLLATFRAVYGGLQHDRLTLPAYGGSLFDPDRFPFLEGRLSGTRWAETPADPMPVNNRTVLHLLEALQILRVKVPGGGPAEARRLSFRALEIGQIGHVYESLLDHTARRAAEPVLGLTGTKGKEPNIPLGELEGQVAKGETSFVAYLKEQTGRSEPALRRALLEAEPATHASALIGQDRAALRVACQNDDVLLQRVLPFAELIRDDDFGYPVVVSAGSVFVTAGSDRRSTGTHYTPRSLTEPIVQHTLEPLVYFGPAEGLPKEQWRLRSPAELLALRICDMSMGSGAFLVQVCIYLAERLVEAWEELEGQNVLRPRITPEGKPSTGAPGEQLIPLEPDERMIFARRIVADRCIYGVDKNPLAVEMAKLSLWLVTLAKGRPFSFLDHALKCGDSLVGADEAMFLTWAHSVHDSTMTLFDEEVRKQLEAAREARRALEGFEVREVRDAERKAALLAEADAAMARVKRGCDLLIGVRLLELSAKQQEAQLNTLLLEYMANEVPNSELAREAIAAASNVRAFHWPFEFPEVFERGGFGAFVGNPPFLGGVRISELHGEAYNDYICNRFPPASKKTDLCAFFLRRADQLLEPQGLVGLITTNTISQGTTRKGGLATLIAGGSEVIYARPSFTWPGAASVIAAYVILSKGHWKGEHYVDGIPCAYISDLLTPEIGRQVGIRALHENDNLTFQGSSILGMGFFVPPEFAYSLIRQDEKLRDVVVPAMGGSELNQQPDLVPTRWIIDMGERDEVEAKTYELAFQHLEKHVKPERLTKDPLQYPRLTQTWWKFWHSRTELYGGIKRLGLSRVLVRARVSDHNMVAFLPTKMVYTEQLVVFLLDKWSDFEVLQSSLHDAWARRYASTLKTDVRYIPPDCFGTFPRPSKQNLSVGEQYYDLRQQMMHVRQEGLTTTYNRFHNPDEGSADIARLRDLHVEMDNAVAAAYGWGDLGLGHGFHETAQGVRFTISEEARREVLAELLNLNHERYAEEVRLGLHEKKGKKAAKSDGEAEGEPGKRGRKKVVKEEGPEYGTRLFE